jgi:hypothetical protein
MIFFVENKQRPQGLSEKTEYQNISLRDAVLRLKDEIAGKSVRCHFGHTDGASFMEARYSVLKISGAELRFLDTNNVNNNLNLYLRDVVKVEIGEDIEANFVTFRLDLKDKTFISVTPMI